MELLRSLGGLPGWIGRIDWSPDGKRIITPSGDGTVRVWDAATGDCIDLIGIHSHIVTAAASHPDGEIVASASYDNTVKIWDLNTRQLVRSISGHAAPVLDVAFHPSGERLATIARDGTLKLWEAKTGNILSSLDIPRAERACLAFNRSGELLAYSDLREIHVCDPISAKNLYVIRDASTAYLSMAFHPDGILATAGADGRILFWDHRSAKPIRAFEGHTEAARAVAFSADGSLLASQGTGKDSSIRVWKLNDAGGLSLSTELNDAFDSVPFGFKFNPCSPILAATTYDVEAQADALGYIHLWAFQC